MQYENTCEAAPTELRPTSAALSSNNAISPGPQPESGSADMKALMAKMSLGRDVAAIKGTAAESTSGQASPGAILDWYAGAPESASMSPSRDAGDTLLVQVRPGKLHEALTAAESVLARTNDYYQHGGRVVRAQTNLKTKVMQIQELDAQGLVVALAGLSTWTRFDKRTGGWTPIDPCPRVCKLLAESWPHSQLLQLSGLVHQPYLRPDATICDKPGYDSNTHLLGVFDATDVRMPEHPTLDDAVRALGLLTDLLSECAFATPDDRSAAISALLTAVVRPSLSLAPMFHVMAHQPGTGKSFLCQLITALATSAPSTPVAFPRSNDACDKLLLAQLMRSPAVIEFDNLTSDLRPYDKLCSALTSEHLEGRKLGVSRTVMVGTKVLMLSSGNNVRPVEDMVRRCVSIHLDPGLETPAARVYKSPNLLDEVRSNRIKYVTAALTIVRAWVVAGRPMAVCQPLASYAAWSDWCRQPLLWLDQPDPAASVFRGLQEDPAQLLVGRVLQGWHERHGSAPMMVRQVVGAFTHLYEEDDFREALVDAAGGNETINVRKLGNWLARNEGKVVGTLRLRRFTKTRNAENWMVESVASVTSVPSS